MFTLSSLIASNVNPVYYFLKENAQFFAIIGLIGTMLSLMPSFLNSISDSVWMGEKGFNGLIILVSAIIAVIFFMILIILLMLEALSNQNRLTIVGLLFIFFIFIFGFIFLIYFAIVPYIWATFLINYVLLFFLIPILIVIGISIYEIFVRRRQNPNLEVRHRNTRSVYQTYQRGRRIQRSHPNRINRFSPPQQLSEIIAQMTPGLKIVLYLSIIIIICSLFWVPLAYLFDNSTKNAQDQSNQKNVQLIQNFEQNGQIISDSQYYNSKISGSYGLGLTVSNITQLPPQNITDYSFNWRTDHGYFIKWIPNEQRFIYLSNITKQNGLREKILWTYDPSDIDKDQENVTISLDIQNKTGYHIENRSLTLEWVERDIVEVQ